MAFGQWFDLNLDVFFRRKGRPILFGYNFNNIYEVNFTLATLADDSSISQQSTMQQSIPNESFCQIDKLNMTAMTSSASNRAGTSKSLANNRTANFPENKMNGSKSLMNDSSAATNRPEPK